MPNDDPTSTTSSSNARDARRSLFSVPQPLKRLFDNFPLITYETNAFPFNATQARDQHTLYVFTTTNESRDGAPSFNPGCLKWQTYLKISGLSFQTRPSNNHASPSGSLPYLVSSAASNSETVAVKSLKKWVSKQKNGVDGTTDVRFEAYASLIDGIIRAAWLYQLYILPANRSVVHELYVSQCSSNPIVQTTVHHQLRAAAEAELRKLFLHLKEEDLWRRVEEAFSALSTLLGEDEWFFGGKATAFDASVFAYTHLLLDHKRMNWKQNKIAELLEKHSNLLSHRDRIIDLYY